jgi:hypothetical protein
LKYRLCTFLTICASIAISAETAKTTPPILVTPVTGQVLPFKIIGTKLNAPAREAEINVEGGGGIFAFHFHPPDEPLKKVTFVVKKEIECEAFTFWPKVGKPTHLREEEGFALRRRGKDLVIELTGRPLAILMQGGKIQFVDTFR